MAFVSVSCVPEGDVLADISSWIRQVSFMVSYTLFIAAVLQMFKTVLCEALD